jgi:hypothetical protein
MTADTEVPSMLCRVTYGTADALDAMMALSFYSIVSLGVPLIGIYEGLTTHPFLRDE